MRKNFKIKYLWGSAILLMFFGCVSNTPRPYYVDDKDIRMLNITNAYYINKIGIREKIVLRDTEFHTMRHWYKNRWITSCFGSYNNKICLVDVNNTGVFNHLAVVGQAALYPLEKVSSYEIQAQESFMSDLPAIYYDKSISSEPTIIHVPRLNIKNTAEVGGAMYSKYNLFHLQTQNVSLFGEINGFTKDIYGNNEEKFSFNNVVPLPLLSLSVSDNNYKTVCFMDSEICLIDTDNSGYFTYSILKGLKKQYPLSSKVQYKLAHDVKITENSFKYIVLYQGKIGNRIKFSFREFKNNMSRASFTQDIEYELDQNNTTVIGFRGLRIKIIKATNFDITYKVIQDYALQ